MLIDFEKAFESILWNFLYRTLKFFALREKFINWIKLFNNDTKAYVLQCGFLSEPINIRRRCKQGDPFLHTSSYLEQKF